MGDDMEQPEHEPGIVGGQYLAVRDIVSILGPYSDGLPMGERGEILGAIVCDICAAGHRLAVYMIQFGDMD